MRRAYKIIKIEYARPAFDLSNTVVADWMYANDKYESMNIDGCGVIDLTRDEAYDLIAKLEEAGFNDEAQAIIEDLNEQTDIISYSIF